MTTLTQGKNTAEHLVWEAHPDHSRERVTILSGENLVAGQVVAKWTATGANKGKYTAWDPAASAEADGTTTPAGVLYAAVDATSADKPGVIHARSCVVNASELSYAAGAQQSEKTAALATLATLGVVAR